MALSAAQITALQALTKPKVCEYLAVYWDPDDAAENRYYGTQAYNQLAGFTNIGHKIEARIIGDPFREFEINPDLRTETIEIVLDDINKAIRGKFQSFGSGVNCELFYYYPDVDGTESLWFGQLQAPQIYGWKRITTVATNGFRSREQLSPWRMRPPDHCTAKFGPHLPTLEALRTNGCGYDRDKGGSTGLLNGAVPFTDCLRDEASCTARFGDLLSYLGFDTDAGATVSDQRTGYVARSFGNASRSVQPIRVIAGTKHVRGMMPLLYRRELNQNHPDQGWFASVIEVGEGPVRNIRNIKVNGITIQQLHLDIRNGLRRQSKIHSYNQGGAISNFSKTAHFSNRFQCNPLDVTPQNLAVEADVDGYRDVAVFNPTDNGNGLIGEYFTGITWTDLIGTRVDHSINFTSNTQAPMEGIESTNFSVRWQGQITPAFTETVTFKIDHDDGVKLWVDNTVVIDQLGTVGTHTGNIALTADVPVNIRIDFIQGNTPPPHPWYCILKWSSASLPEEVVPNDVLTHAGSSGFIRQWTNDRVWWLLEEYTNQNFGLSNPFSRFHTQSFIETSVWGLQTVNFSLVSTDNETKNFSHRRTTFDAILEGRGVAEQITDICRSGSIAVPFQYQGLYRTRAFRVATSDEFTNAKVFTDTGQSRNIIWTDGAPAIEFSQTPNDKIVNEITLTFEAADNFDEERPITVRDPFQQILAGRSLGGEMLQSVPARYAAFGVRNLNEAVKLGHRLLRFGEFDTGGIQNNARLRIITPFEHVLGLIRYEIIKVVSGLLDGFTVGTNDGVNNWVESLEYFRVLNIQKVTNHLAEITAQAYNHTAYTAFETVTNPNPVPPGPTTPSPGPGPTPIPCQPTFGAVTFDAQEGVLLIPVEPC